MLNLESFRERVLRMAMMRSTLLGRRKGIDELYTAPEGKSYILKLG
jgi:hypothetical protein